MSRDCHELVTSMSHEVPRTNTITSQGVLNAGIVIASYGNSMTAVETDSNRAAWETVLHVVCVFAAKQ